ncbi:MAG: PLP-dependent aminotransferase family protein [Chloroflexi bacterium]|nr:PLP-dependent aminotransferase family protein [Chloroflexota bacterium]
MTATRSRIHWTKTFAERTRTGTGGGLAAILALVGRTDIISFAGGLPDPATMPDEKLADVMRDLLASGDSSALQYAPIRGLPTTLAYVAERLEAKEGLRPGADQTMITSGCVEALELLGKTFLDAGDTVVVEAPTYLGATMGFRSFGAKVVEVPMDSQGVRVDLLEAALAASPRPKFFYTVPDFQNPTGYTLSRERRRRLVELARRYAVPVVEDVTYRELWLYGGPPPSLWSLGPDVAVQIGTFSKTFFPGVRLGWAAGPAEIIAQMILAKQNTDQCAGAMGQRLLVEYGRRGYLDRQVEQSRSFYRRRRELLIAALLRHMPDGVSWTEPMGGFVAWLTLPAGIDADRLAVQAMDEGVAFVPGSVFFCDPALGRLNLRLSYSNVQDDTIDEGVRRLKDLIQRSMKI